MSISKDLAPRYLKIFLDDSYDFVTAIQETKDIPSIDERFRFRFDIFKSQFQTFEKLFHDTSAPLVINPGRYQVFILVVNKFIQLIENKLKQNVITKKDVHDLNIVYDELDNLGNQILEFVQDSI